MCYLTAYVMAEASNQLPTARRLLVSEVSGKSEVTHGCLSAGTPTPANSDEDFPPSSAKVVSEATS